MSGRKTHELYRAFSRWGWDAKGYTPRTRYQYYILGLRAEGWMREHRNQSLVWATPKDLKAFLFSLPATAATRNGARKALIAIFEFFIEQEITDQNPARALPRLPVPRYLPKALNPEQADKLVAAAMMFSLEVGAMFLTFAFGGLRISEVRYLERSHIEEDGWIRFRHGKGNKERAVPIHADLAPVLGKWLIEDPSARWVFPSPLDPERTASIGWIRAQVRMVGEAIGLDIYPHMLRHTAATRLLETGADLRTVQEFLGHANVSTTTVYVKVRPVRLANAMKRMTYKPIPELPE